MNFFSTERRGAVVHLRMDDAERANALSAAFWRELPSLLAEIGADASARAIVLSGSGKHFCGGLDLASFAHMQTGAGETEGARWRANFRANLMKAQAALSALERHRLPVIAAVQGACFGAGLDLALACDLRFVARDVQFCVYETRMGLTPDAGTLPRLAKLVPEGVARDFVYSGRYIKAEEAERRGLANAIAETGHDALVMALAYADELAERSPLAIQGSKEMLNYGRDHTTADTLRYIAAWQAGMLSFPDIEASIAAQRDKAAPRYADVRVTASLFERDESK